MKFILRKSTLDDLDAIYKLHLECFEQSDQWYKRIISQYLLTGYVIETIIDSDHSKSVISKKLVGVLLQGNIKPCSNDLKLNDISFQQSRDSLQEAQWQKQSFCNQELILATQVADINSTVDIGKNLKFFPDNICDNFLFEHNLNYENDPSKFHYLDIFVPINENGHIFLQNNAHVKEYYGIVMLCIHEKFRGQGLAKKLINKHLKSNLNKILCLHTRKSNLSAYNLYKKVGYDHIAYIKNKYFFPTEDSIFMIIKPNN
jgi:ribosomal protein S18 acetylase RimI-like enzyme